MHDLTRDAAAACANFHPVVCYSSPDKEDKQGEHYHESGRISADLLKKVLPHKKFHFYFCGPGPMMSDLAEGLAAWGVPEPRVHFEAFGPSSIRKKIGAASAKITLRKSKKVLQWDGTHSSILETAEAAGVKLRFGCRAGNCGTCSVKLTKGEVVYGSEPSAPHSSSQCLACVGIPNSDIEINA
jgi:ferredoxin